MLKLSFRFHKIIAKFFFLFGIIILPVFFGCATNYGSLKPSPYITEIFETNQILTDHIYYYNGFKSAPYAIIGIYNEYALHSSGWRKIIDPTADQLNTLVFRMRNVWDPMPKGAWIIGPNDERLGVWYSSQRWTSVRSEKNNTIFVASPQPSETRAIQIR